MPNEDYADKNYITADLKNNRIRNTAKTVAANVCRVIILTIGPFIIRTLIIYKLGEAYAGINSVITSIMSILNLTELGLSNIIVYFLYNPLAMGNFEKVRGYLNAFKKIYRTMGCIVFIAGMCCMLLLPYMIAKDIPSDVNIYTLFFLSLISNTIMYFIHPEIIIIANALQRGYIAGWIDFIGTGIVYVLQFVAIYTYESIGMYYIAILIQSLFLGVLRGVAKKCCFMDFEPHGNINDDEKNAIKKKTLALMGHQMDEVFISSADNIIISAFLGLTLVAKYGNYMYVVSAVTMFFSAVINSFTASIGNSLLTESEESNYIRFKAVLMFNGVIVSWAMGSMLCLYQPFMMLWMGDRLFAMDTVLLFCIYFFVSQIRKTVIMFKNARGMWWEDRYKPYISMIVNLIIDFVLVNLMGVNGALISSIICIMIIEIPWEGKVFYNDYLMKSVWEYIKSINNYFLYGTVFAVIAYGICEQFFSKAAVTFFQLILRVMVVTAIYAVSVMAVFGRSAEMKTWIETIGIMVDRKKS